jgi:hypothetical protein
VTYTFQHPELGGVKTRVYNALLPVFRRYFPNDDQNMLPYLKEFVEAIVAKFEPNSVSALTCALHFKDPLSSLPTAEYIVRLRKWNGITMRGEIRSSDGVPHTMDRTLADVPVFWGKSQFVGLWLPEVQSETLRVAYVTHP